MFISREKSGKAKIFISGILFLITLNAVQAANNNSGLFDPTDIIFEQSDNSSPPQTNTPAKNPTPDPNAAKTNTKPKAPKTDSSQTKIIIEEPIKQPVPQKQNPPKQNETVDIIVEEKQTLPAKSTEQVKQSLIKEKISAPVSNDNSDSSNALIEMIEKIRSIRFESGKTLIEQFTKEEPQHTPEEKIIAADADTIETEKKIAETRQIQPSAAKGLISQETLKELQALTEKPQLTENPLLIAEILFLDGQKEQASIFYSEAIERLKKQGTLSIHDKAWFLLQTASCFKAYNSEKASQTYKEILSECPSSPWAPIAKSQSDLLDWLQAEKPYELIKQCRSELIMTINERRVQ